MKQTVPQTRKHLSSAQWVNFNERADFSFFPWNFDVIVIHMHRKVEKRTTKRERLLETVGRFNFKILVVPHLKFWKWQCKIFSTQKLNAILVSFKMVKLFIVIAFRIALLFTIITTILQSTRPPVQTKNDTALKFGTPTLLRRYLITSFFLFFGKSDP